MTAPCRNCEECQSNGHRKRETGPRDKGTGSQESVAGADGSLLRCDDPRDELARVIDGTFVVVVKATGGRFRRRAFLTVAAAEKATEKARLAGHTATVYLAELKPVWKLSGGGF